MYTQMQLRNEDTSFNQTTVHATSYIEIDVYRTTPEMRASPNHIDFGLSILK